MITKDETKGFLASNDYTFNYVAMSEDIEPYTEPYEKPTPHHYNPPDTRSDPDNININEEPDDPKPGESNTKEEAPTKDSEKVSTVKGLQGWAIALISVASVSIIGLIILMIIRCLRSTAKIASDAVVDVRTENDAQAE